MRYKSFWFGCFSAILVLSITRYVRTKIGVVPANTLFNEISVVNAHCSLMGDTMFFNYAQHTLATLDIDEGALRTADFGPLEVVNGRDYASKYCDRDSLDSPIFSLLISNKNNKCAYIDMNANGTFDERSFGKQKKEIWLNDSWVPATLIATTHRKEATQARVDSILYEFNRTAGVWEAVDDEN